MNHISLIHGIHQGLTNPNWTHDLQNELELNLPRVAIETESYSAGAFPPWNIWVKNPRYAKAHANRIKQFSDAYTRSRLPATAASTVSSLPSLGVHLVAHSNGTNIAVGAVQRLAKMSVKVNTLILMGSAVHSDIERSGLADLVSRGALNRVVAYCSDDDRVIRPLQSIPGCYGSLGTRGLERDGKPVGLRVEKFQPIEEAHPWASDRFSYVTRWFEGFGHSEWMHRDQKEATFRAITSDLRLQSLY